MPEVKRSYRCKVMLTCCQVWKQEVRLIFIRLVQCIFPCPPHIPFISGSMLFTRKAFWRTCRIVTEVTLEDRNYLKCVWSMQCSARCNLRLRCASKQVWRSSSIILPIQKGFYCTWSVCNWDSSLCCSLLINCLTDSRIHTGQYQHLERVVVWDLSVSYN